MPEHLVYRCDRTFAVEPRSWVCVVLNEMFSFHHEESFIKIQVI